MASFLNCDGCGNVIRRNQQGDTPWVRLEWIVPGRSSDLGRFGLGTKQPSWDFCSVGCAATWAVQHEAASTARPAP